MTGAGSASAAPLAGIRILDLSRVVAGPYLGRVLADLGAEVLKVEPPQGDQSRDIAPPHDRGMSALFTFANAGKRGLCVDLRRPGGAELVLELAAACDAVVENFRPGVLDRLGLGWDALQRANPRTVLVSLNGFGSDSSWRSRRAYAPIVHAAAGVLRDQADYAGQPVAQQNDARADTTAALHGAIALLAALRVAGATGRGQRVEVPLFDALLASYSEAGNALLDGPDERRMNPIYDAGRHGAIATAGPEHYVWLLVRDAHGEPDDPAPRDADRATKTRLRRAALEAWMDAQPDREVLLERLATAGIASAPVSGLREALTSPFAKERGLLVEVDDRRGGARAVVRSPARFERSPAGIRGPAPRRGEHNAEVLRSVLGYDEARIRALREAGVLSEADPEER